jgi:hypothetical protein
MKIKFRGNDDDLIAEGYNDLAETQAALLDIQVIQLMRKTSSRIRRLWAPALSPSSVSRR